MKKKIIIFLLMFGSLLLVGCDENMTAKEAVRDYLEMYVTLDDRVTDQLDEFVNKEDLSDEQKEKYKEVLRKEYTSLSYSLENERVEGDVAYITAKVNVIDLYKVQKDALNYFEEHKDEFNNEDGEYDKNRFLDYKLDQMKMATDTIDYEIEFKVVNEGNNEWVVSQLSNESLEKLHGIYNYEE